MDINQAEQIVKAIITSPTNNEAISNTLPELMMISAKTEDVIRLFKSGDIAARKAFIATCPPSPRATSAVLSLDMELALTALNFLAEPYCRGIDRELGITLSEASYLLSRQAFEETPNLSGQHLFNTAKSAINYAIALSTTGSHTELISFVTNAINWLEAKGYKEATSTLLLYKIEAYIKLAEFAQAETLLTQTNWQDLILDTQPTEYQRQEGLCQKLKEIAQRRATELESPALPDAEVIKQTRQQMLKYVESLAKLSPDIAEQVEQFVELAKPKIEQDIPNSLAEWVIRSQHMMDRLTRFLSGEFFTDDNLQEVIKSKDSEFNQLQLERPIRNHLQLQQQIRNASLIFAPNQPRHPKAIEQAGLALTAAQDWAKQHNFKEEENNALWGLYLYYNHIAEDSQAVEVLQALRKNLEVIRTRISNPQERAGVMRSFPHLFGNLCQLLYRLNRPMELLEAIEGAKGRVLADVLTRHSHQPMPDGSFSATVQQLPTLMQAVTAHYISYFVDDEETFAVLVAKDGSLRTHSISIGKTKLKEWLGYKHNREERNPINPKNWGNKYRGGEVPKDIYERLAPLVSWLENESNLVELGDHICYCPDEQLHLIPFHCLLFRGEPLVRYASLSRIHSALALTELLKRKPVRPHQFTVVQVTAQDDQKLPEKVEAFQQVAKWLSNKKLRGDELTEEKADLPGVFKLPFAQRLVHFATHGIFPNKFPNKDKQNQEINPYHNSGLLLAKNGHLPSNSLEEADDALLTPKQLLEHRPRLNFWSSHVTMQACVTGLAKEGIGGDALGLEWAFFQVGASSLLATHWNAHAKWAAQFSVNFYQKWLFEQASRAQAWRETMLEIMDSHEENLPDPKPYYWAAFSLSGDWR